MIGLFLPQFSYNAKKCCIPVYKASPYLHYQRIVIKFL